MWSLSQEEWNAIAALAQIAGAIATAAAVVVALMLGLRQTAERLTVRTSIYRKRTVQSDALRTGEVEVAYAVVKITNIGLIPVHLAGITWRDAPSGDDVALYPAVGPGTKEILGPGTSKQYWYEWIEAKDELTESETSPAFYRTVMAKPRVVRVATERGGSFTAQFPPRHLPAWLRRLLQKAPSEKFELVTVDKYNISTTSFPDQFPARMKR